MADQDDRSVRDEDVPESQADTEVADSKTESSNLDTPIKEEAELSRKAQQMGESRKRMAEALLSLAKAGDAAAKAQLLTLTQDEQERVYFEKKFGDDFSSLVEARSEGSPKLDDALAKQVDLLVKDREAARKLQMASAKEKLGLSLEKADTFDDLVKTLEGKVVGGRSLTFEDAVDMAAKQLVPGAPSASALLRGDVSVRPEDTSDKVEVPISEEFINRHARYTGSKSKEDYVPLVTALEKDGAFKPKL